MMMDMTVAIIGAGPAGVTAARTLREENFSGTIRMFSAEDVPPYSPAALGEFALTGDEELLYWQGRDFFARFGIEAHTGQRVVRVEPERRILQTENGGSFAFDYLVIASGSSLFIPPSVKGSDRADILNFKSLTGARHIRELAGGKSRSATILGGGFIGVEIALCLAKVGIKPTVLNRRGWVMPRLLDRETSACVLEDLQKQGVEALLNTEGEQFVGDKRTEALLTTDGRTLFSDMFVAATGVKPNICFVAGSGIETDETFIPVNSRLQTNFDRIYACGDVAGTIDFISGQSVVHALHTTAVSHGRTVARNILGHNEEYEPQIGMNSLKELGFKLIVVGSLEGEELAYRKNGVLRKVFLNADGQINGYVLLGDVSNAGWFLSLLKKRSRIDPGKKTRISFPDQSRALTMTRFL
jgi:NAD(P)H-nitrite reductase large subunit